MGGINSTEGVTPTKEQPGQFITQPHCDFVVQCEDLYRSVPTITKTVILPPGVELNDPRLADGVVVNENTYDLDPGNFPEFPEDVPFEVDVDPRLLPPCWGQEGIPAHYAVYPTAAFKELNCGYCELHHSAHPEMTIAPGAPEFGRTWSRPPEYMGRQCSLTADELKRAEELPVPPPEPRKLSGASTATGGARTVENTVASWA